MNVIIANNCCPQDWLKTQSILPHHISQPGRIVRIFTFLVLLPQVPPGPNTHFYLESSVLFWLTAWLVGCCCSQLVQLQLQNKILCSAPRSQIIAALIFSYQDLLLYLVVVVVVVVVMVMLVVGHYLEA